MTVTIVIWVLGLGALLLLIPRLLLRLQLSRAKHRSLAGHAKMSRRLARLIPFYEYDESQFFGSDGAPEDVAAARRAGFERLSRVFAERFQKTAALTGEFALCLDYGTAAATLAHDLEVSVAAALLQQVVPIVLPHADRQPIRLLLPRLADPRGADPRGAD